MAGIIRPTTGVSVNLGQGGSFGNSGINIGTNNNQQQQVSELDAIKGYLNNGVRGLARSGGGFNWASTNVSNSSDDRLLRELMAKGDDVETTHYFLERSAAFVKAYVQQLVHRSGPIYASFNEALAGFRIDQRSGLPDKTLEAFVADVTKQTDFNHIVALNGAPYFGSYLVQQMRSGKEQLNIEDIKAGTTIATRNVLYFEMISWLVNSDNGNIHINNLSPTISDSVGNLAAIKEKASLDCANYGVDFSYKNLEFKVRTVTAPDYHLLSSELTKVASGEYNYYANQNRAEDNTNLEAWLANRSNNLKRNNIATENNNRSINSWENHRTDLENLTKNNKHEFDLPQYFKPIKRNTYYIREEHFNLISKVMTPANNCIVEAAIGDRFRVITIDLLDDPELKYESKVVRLKGETVSSVLSNPAILLPKLENPEGLEDAWQVHNHTIEKTDRDALKELQELNYKEPRVDGTRVITHRSKLVNKDLKTTKETLGKLNTLLTDNKENVNSVYETTCYGTYTFNNNEEKIKVLENADYLFKNNNSSYVKNIKRIKRDFSLGHISESLYDFLSNYLTEKFNDYVVGVLGYDIHNQNNHLSVNDIFKAIDELVEFALNKDSKLYEILLHEGENYLNNTLVLFKERHLFMDEEDPLLSFYEDRELLITRDLVVGVLNSSIGPIANKEPLIVSRSNYPEYFSVIETGMEELRPDKDKRNIDKLIYFSKSKELWVFTYSEVDDNMGKIRLVEDSEHLVLLKQYKG